jgi:aconitate hydratase 2/2-methylisocitrate dehydratase
MAHIGVINQNADQIYRYMNFDQISEFREVADSVEI